MTHVAFRLRLHGLVQGVYCRDGTVALATRLGLDGWVRNLDDGTVDARVQGTEDAVGAFLVGLRQPSPDARVTRVEIVPDPVIDGDPGFTRRPTAPAEPLDATDRA